MKPIPTKMEGYPIGQQDFMQLREDGATYVDKTEFVEKIVMSKNRYYFLARPRRFGKSLFLSTLKYFFEGRRELFKGLKIDNSDWNWESYPVLHLDLNTDRYEDIGILEEVLDNRFRYWEEKYGVAEVVTNLSLRFKNIIEAAHKLIKRPDIRWLSSWMNMTSPWWGISIKMLISIIIKQNLQAYIPISKVPPNIFVSFSLRVSADSAN